MDKRATEDERQTRPQPERDGPHRTVEQLFRDAQGQALFANSNQDAYQVDPSLIQQGLDLAKQTGGYAAAAIKDGYDVLGSAIPTPSPFGADLMSGLAQGPGIVPSAPNAYQQLITQYFEFIGSLTRMAWGQGQNPVHQTLFGQSQTPPWPGMGSPQPAAPNTHFDPSNPASYLYASVNANNVNANDTQPPGPWPHAQTDAAATTPPNPFGQQATPSAAFGAQVQTTEPLTPEQPIATQSVRFENSLHTSAPTTLTAFWHDLIPEGELQLQPLRSVSDELMTNPPITTRWVFNEQSRTQRLAISIEPSCAPGCYAAAIIDSLAQPCGQIVVTIDPSIDSSIEPPSETRLKN